MPVLTADTIRRGRSVQASGSSLIAGIICNSRGRKEEGKVAERERE